MNSNTTKQTLNGTLRRLRAASDNDTALRAWNAYVELGRTELARAQRRTRLVNRGWLVAGTAVQYHVNLDSLPGLPRVKGATKAPAQAGPCGCLRCSECYDAAYDAHVARYDARNG